MDEVVFSNSDNYSSIHYQVKVGNLIPIYQGIYTINKDDSLESITLRNWYKISKHLFKGSILSHRTAFELKPSPKGRVYITGKSDKTVELPGIKFVVRKNELGEKGIKNFDNVLFKSSESRAFIENLQPSRSIDGEKRVLAIEELEEKLVNILNTRGESALNALRDEAKEYQKNKAYNQLSSIISSLLSTKPSVLVSDFAKHTATGNPYDKERINLLVSKCS